MSDRERPIVKPVEWSLPWDQGDPRAPVPEIDQLLRWGQPVADGSTRSHYAQSQPPAPPKREPTRDQRKGLACVQCGGKQGTLLKVGDISGIDTSHTRLVAHPHCSRGFSKF